jgi:hypothetical protein
MISPENKRHRGQIITDSNNQSIHVLGLKEVRMVNTHVSSVTTDPDPPAKQQQIIDVSEEDEQPLSYREPELNPQQDWWDVRIVDEQMDRKSSEVKQKPRTASDLSSTQLSPQSKQRLSTVSIFLTLREQPPSYCTESEYSLGASRIETIRVLDNVEDLLGHPQLESSDSVKKSP